MKIYRRIEYNCIGIKVMSQSKILLIFSFTFVHVLLYECPLYLPNEALPNITCIKKSENDERTMYLKKCEPNLVCNSGSNRSNSQNYGHCTEKYLYENKYPGEYCTKYDKCSISECENNRCKGRQENEQCKSHYECDAGLYCNTGICIKLIEDNKTKCNDDFECQFDRVCNNEVCVVQGSLDVGEEANNLLACRTLYIYNGKCTEGPTLDRKGDNGTKEEAIQCPEDGKCTYRLNTTSITKDCVCALGVSRDKICPPGEGDFDLNPYISYARGYKKARCTSPDRLFCKDKPIVNMGKDYYDAYIVYTNVTSFSDIYNNTFYAKYIMNYDYWYSRMHSVYIEREEISYAFLFVTLAVVLLGDSVLLMLYFRKLKSDAEIIDRMN